MSWTWNTQPLSWREKCSACRQPLRVQGDGGIVIWIDSQHYHVGCLLDQLAFYRSFQLPVRETAAGDSVYSAGLVP